MAANSVKFLWKAARPLNPQKYHDMMFAAYQTAVATDADVTAIMIRSGIHKTTWDPRLRRYVKDDPHITVNFKNAAQAADKTFMTSHGYTASDEDLNIVRVRPKGVISRDNDKDQNGRDKWPAVQEEETIDFKPIQLSPAQPQ